MYTLLAMCLVLHPQSIDESVQSVLTDKYHDRMLKMSRGDRKVSWGVFFFGGGESFRPAMT